MVSAWITHLPKLIGIQSKWSLLLYSIHLNGFACVYFVGYKWVVYLYHFIFIGINDRCEI